MLIETLLDRLDKIGEFNEVELGRMFAVTTNEELSTKRKHDTLF
jgi:hypothetical protein